MNKPTFFEHLDELRSRLLVSLAAVLAAAAAGYLFADPAVRFLFAPARSLVGELYFFSPADAFLIKVKTAGFIGLLAASPVVLGQVWFFVVPALYPNEKKIVLPLAAASAFLFLSGAAFSFYAVVPPALKFLLGMQTETLRPMISAGGYLSFLCGLLLAFGVAFNMPVFVAAVVWSGLIAPSTLRRYHRHALVLILIAAAVLTPGPDVVSQILLAVPLAALFEISVLAALMIGRRRAARRLEREMGHA